MANTIFKDKTLLITGGTGSFGHTVLKHFFGRLISARSAFSAVTRKKAGRHAP